MNNLSHELEGHLRNLLLILDSTNAFLDDEEVKEMRSAREFLSSLDKARKEKGIETNFKPIKEEVDEL